MSSESSPDVLSQHHLNALRTRGLSDETIRLAGLRTECDPERLQRILRWQFPAKGLGAGIVIPFFDILGQPAPYARVRLDTPLCRQDGSAAKYQAPAGLDSRIYFPTRVRAVRSDAAVPIAIAEGEFKALAGDQHGVATIGISGCSMWSKKKESENEERTLHPDLLDIEWKGRVVYIVFDSDTVYKDGPRFEEWMLARSLAGAGARVKIVRVPQRIGGDKVGLDDFLAAAVDKAEKELNRLLAEARDPTLPSFGCFENFIQLPHPDKPGEIIKCGRSLVEMAVELAGRSQGWPKNIGGVLVGPDAAKGTRALESANALAAFIHGVYDRGSESRVTFLKNPGFPPCSELYAYLESHGERFDRADSLPHVPPLPGVFYTKPAPIPDGKLEAIAELFRFFDPATPEDKSLLLAMLLTLFWGGPAGKRPGFLIEGEENDPEAGRGLGKSTVAQKFAQLAGGAFDINAGEPFSRTQNRLLTPEAGHYRVLLMDNVKTFRLSCAELEGLITNPFINGHRLYHGQAGVPNYYTLIVTLNGASLSKDFAQRLITIRLKRMAYRHGWEAELDRFVEQNRERLIGDIVGLLRRPAVRLSEVRRWGPWETEVLARVRDPEKCWKLIGERAEQHDADREDADRIRETLVEIVRRHNSTQAHEQRFLLSSAAVTALVSQSLNNRQLAAAAASATIKALGVKGFSKSDRNGRRFWLWSGDDYSKPARELMPMVLTFNPELQRNDMGRVIGDHWSFVSLEEFAPETSLTAK